MKHEHTHTTLLQHVSSFSLCLFTTVYCKFPSLPLTCHAIFFNLSILFLYHCTTFQVLYRFPYSLCLTPHPTFTFYTFPFILSLGYPPPSPDYNRLLPPSPVQASPPLSLSPLCIIRSCEWQQRRCGHMSIPVLPPSRLASDTCHTHTHIYTHTRHIHSHYPTPASAWNSPMRHSFRISCTTHAATFILHAFPSILSKFPSRTWGIKFQMQVGPVYYQELSKSKFR